MNKTAFGVSDTKQKGVNFWLTQGSQGMDQTMQSVGRKNLDIESAVDLATEYDGNETLAEVQRDYATRTHAQ